MPAMTRVLPDREKYATRIFEPLPIGASAGWAHAPVAVASDSSPVAASTVRRSRSVVTLFLFELALRISLP